MRMVALCLLLLGMPRANAQPTATGATVLSTPPPASRPPDPASVEIAQSRFSTGKVLFRNNRFQEALVEFEAANEVLHKPEFDYNIGSCLAKLGRNSDAVERLERYIRIRPNDPDAAWIWQTIAELRAKIVAEHMSRLQAQQQPAVPPARATRSATGATPPSCAPRPGAASCAATQDIAIAT